MTPPHLYCYGTVAEMTKTGSTGSLIDGGKNLAMRKTGP